MMSTNGSLRRILSLILIPASLGATCGGHPTEPATVSLGQPFELRAGESAVVPGGLRVTFDRVVSDSRCPIDAICVWAGEAVVALTLSRGAGAAVEREVRADSFSPEIAHLEYRIRAIGVAPYPRSDRKTPLEEFVATFTVTR
jgi:hypothetical protein